MPRRIPPIWPRSPSRRRGLLRWSALTFAVACSRSEPCSRADQEPLLVYNAAAIARPMRAVLDSFSQRTGRPYQQETAASLELARKSLELKRPPDVLVLADPAIFPSLLEPTVTRWHALFARNRIVLAYTPRSRGADRIDASNWWQVITEPGVEVGRADPHTDPSGYRTLLVWQLAELHYGIRGLAARLAAAAPARNVRPREADQVALLQAGEYDYTWTYQNLAEQAGFRFVKLPDAIDLGSEADSASYARASVRVTGRTPGDSVTFRGEPILFAVSIPVAAPHDTLAARFAAFLLSPDGRRILRASSFEPLDAPVFRGSGIPPALIP